ncbi:MAG: DNA polymerase IV [Dehalococcoidia bacterium]|jgi:DNA polymerase IV|nr:DNA polymerase IV [Dehalococcoidia bacterium]
MPTTPDPTPPTRRGPPRLPRRVAHFDLDTFFVAVERTLDPSLIGKPVLVGGRDGRGVVAAASYESRVFGCHSAQPMSQALRMCPQAIVVSANRTEYSRVSKLFHELLRDASPVVESVGIDEAYVDFTGATLLPDLDPDPNLSVAATIAEHVRTRVRSELHIAVSVCIAGSRTTAKVGSDRAKPDGLIEVPLGHDATFLASFPIRELPMVGPKLAEALRTAGVATIGDIANLDPRWLENRFGRQGVVLHEHANGRDSTPIRAGARPNRSISRENTFSEDVTDARKLHRTIASHAQRVGTDLRKAGKRARTVTLKLRWHNFETLTRSRTLDRPVQSTAGLLEAGQQLLDEVLGSTAPPGADTVAADSSHSGQLNPRAIRPVRLIGLGATNLVDDELQLELEDLLAAPPGQPLGGELLEDRIDQTLDDINTRFGNNSVTRGL